MESRHLVRSLSSLQVGFSWTQWIIDTLVVKPLTILSPSKVGKRQDDEKYVLMSTVKELANSFLEKYSNSVLLIERLQKREASQNRSWTSEQLEAILAFLVQSGKATLFEVGTAKAIKFASSNNRVAVAETDKWVVQIEITLSKLERQREELRANIEE